MEIIYLKDGQKAQLIEKITANKFLVAPFYEYENHEGDVYEDTGDEKIVDCIFKNPPKKIYDAETLESKNRLEKAKKINTELHQVNLKLKNEIAKLENTKTDFAKLIVNKHEYLTAERLTVINNYTSVDLKKTKGWHNDQYGFSISFGISITKDGISYGVIKLYEDNQDYYMSIDNEIGILINKTDAEITDILKTKISKSKILDRELKGIDDKYLSKELIERKLAFIQQEQNNKISALEKEIELKKTELNLIKNQIFTNL